MACYKLTSCTAGNTTVLWSSDTGFGSVVSPVSLSNHGGGAVSYIVELVEAPCPCGPIDPTVTTAFLIFSPGCTSPYSCYKLQDCTDTQSPYIYVSGNLNPYIGTTVSVAEYPGQCFNVIGVTDPAECDTNMPVPNPVTCVNPCTCNLYCAELTNCVTGDIITVNSTLAFTLNNVIAPTPSIIPQGGNNCWIVTGVDLQPCNFSFGTTITNFVDYGPQPNGCSLCAGPDPCFKLTSCDGQTIKYVTGSLGGFVGGPPIATTVFPNQCWIISNLGPQEDCINSTPVNPLTVSICTCPCYTLTNCTTNQVINSNSNLLSYVGQSVHLTEYGGCQGDCWLVSTNPPPGSCDPQELVTVTTCPTPCGPCGETCYELVDCQTDVVFITVLNPTVNGVNLGTLISGQTIGQVNVNGTITNGCWYVRLAQNCEIAVAASVFNIYQPTQTQTGCEQCLNSCYGLLNCKTLLVDYVIKYTGPNPHGLPNPNTITGTIGNLCFDDPVGCVQGCYIFQLIPGTSCENSVDWTTVVSYDEFENCDDCLPKCYLLTECLPAVTPPFIVSNDLSLYVGNVAKICNAQGECHCYNVELAQTCEGSIILDNANASFTTCEECNSCDCPPGYTKIGDNCQKITTVPATLNPTTYTSAAALPNPVYGQFGTRFYSNISPLPFPLTGVTGPDRFVDLSLTTVPYTSINTGIWGPTTSIAPFFTSRLDTIGIWTNLPCIVNCPPVNEWIGFAKCIDIPTSGTYCIGIAGDDCVRLKLDGVVVAQSCIGNLEFRYWHVFEMNLTAGTHVFVLECKNTVYAAAFGAEIYQTTIANLQTITTIPALQAVTIFTTFPFRTTPVPFQTGENSGYSCPPGSTLNLCGEPSCTIIETIPFVPCAPTYLVTDCRGIQAPFTTNTDLSAYLTGSYETCITTPTYSTTCYLLRDCNRIVPDVITTSNMSSYLWGSVSLIEYPGSCFIVLPMPADTVCVNNPVTLNPELQCNCSTAQQPWPDGCYCVTVEQIAPTPAPDFPGVFNETYYDCCDACTQVCYELTDCSGALEPVIVCNDLEQYLGKVIKIEGCGDICWEVNLSDSCQGSTLFAGKITEFKDCIKCLPPTPPTPPPYDLHLRKIKPGYNSPNSCYTTNYIEKVNCSFAEQVYNAMLVKRYGITVCCEEDLMMWDIKKQLMDLDILKDPKMCKSTLCDCKPPCLIDAVFTLLPFCGDPVIVSVVPNLPCPDPVLTGVVIEVPPIPANCYCYTVTPITGPVTVKYLDCCCEIQTVTTDLSNQFSVCATAPPVVFEGTAGVEFNGDCSETGPCNPPTCYCWKVTNENPLGSPDGTAIFDACCTGTLCVGLYATISVGQSISSCSFAVPSVSAGLTVQNMGPCVDGSCVPPTCNCYEVTSTRPCQYTYTDCNGVTQVTILAGGTNYICAQTPPIPDPACGPDVQINITPYPCNPLTGICGPPSLCICYEVVISDISGAGCELTYKPCGGSPVTTLLSAGTYYYCSEIVPALDPTSFCTITVSPTPYDCQSCGPI